MYNTFYASNIYQTLIISFRYLNNSGKDIDFNGLWNENELVEDLINEGALLYNNGNAVKLRTRKSLLNEYYESLLNEYYEYVEVMNCLCEVKKNEEGLATYDIRIPVADVLVKHIDEYDSVDYGDACDISIYCGTYNELSDNYMTTDSINIDKVERVFKEYFGKYLDMSNFKAEILPLTEKELNELEEDDPDIEFERCDY